MVKSHGDTEDKVLTPVCRRHGVDPTLLKELINVERHMQTKRRRAGLREALDQAFSKAIKDGG